MKKVCPFCNNNKVVKILYGMPNEEGRKEYEKGLIHLGGCCVSPVDYKYHCKCCNEDFNQKFYIELPTIDKIVIDIMDFGSNYEIITMKKNKKDSYLKSDSSGKKIKIDFLKEITHLANAYCLLDLKEEYKPKDMSILDGKVIEITVYSENIVLKSVYCNNEFPKVVLSMIKYLNKKLH